MPTPVSHSASEGQGRSRRAKAWRADSRMSVMESMSVPSRSKRTARGRAVVWFAKGCRADMADRHRKGQHGGMSAPLPSGSRPAVTAELKRLLFRLILTFTLVDAVAISLYY